jgi:hypothetical protein
MRRLCRLAAITVLGAVDDAGATAPAYVTPIMAHTAWTATENCQPVAGVATLPTVLSGHSSRRLSLTGTIVTSWIAATSTDMYRAAGVVAVSQANPDARLG